MLFVQSCVLRDLPACKTHALGTPAFSQILQNLVLTCSLSKSLKIIFPSSLLPSGAISIASTTGNCAKIERHVLADPPRVVLTA